MEWLKKLIEKHTKDGKLDVEALMKEVNAEFPKNAVPKDVYNTLSEAKAKLEKDISERDKQLEALKKVDAEGLKAEIERLQGENKTAKEKFDSEMAKLKKNTAIDIFLSNQKAKNVKAVKALLDMEKVSIDGDNLIGIEEQLKTLKEAEPYLFGDAKPKVGDGTNPPPNNTETGKTFTKEEIEKMTPEEINKNWESISQSMEKGLI